MLYLTVNICEVIYLRIITHAHGDSFLFRKKKQVNAGQSTFFDFS